MTAFLCSAASVSLLSLCVLSLRLCVSVSLSQSLNSSLTLPLAAFFSAFFLVLVFLAASQWPSILFLPAMALLRILSTGRALLDRWERDFVGLGT